MIIKKLNKEQTMIQFAINHELFDFWLKKISVFATKTSFQFMNLSQQPNSKEIKKQNYFFFFYNSERTQFQLIVTKMRILNIKLA